MHPRAAVGARTTDQEDPLSQSRSLALLALSLVSSVLILMTAVMMKKPLDFAIFPTVLLVSTLFRLGLNLASTRLILTHGQEGHDSAGQVINAADLANGKKQFARCRSCHTVGDGQAKTTSNGTGVGVALVEGCTAASADPSKVDVLPLEPAIATTVHMLRPVARPNSLTSRAFTRCMQQALLQVG